MAVAGYAAAMAFIAIGAQHNAAATQESVGMNVDLEPFGVNVEPSAAGVRDALAGQSGHDFIEFALQGSDRTIFINAAAILYFRD